MIVGHDASNGRSGRGADERIVVVVDVDSSRLILIVGWLRWRRTSDTSEAGDGHRVRVARPSQNGLVLVVLVVVVDDHLIAVFGHIGNDGGIGSSTRLGEYLADHLQDDVGHGRRPIVAFDHLVAQVLEDVLDDEINRR